MDDKLETPDFYVRKRRSRTGVLRIEVCDKQTNRVLLTCKVRVAGLGGDCPECVWKAAVKALIRRK